MTDCTVRPAHSDDLLAVLGVHARQEAGGSPPPAPSELESRTWSHMADVAGLCVYLAEMEGEVVGTATSMLLPNVTYDCAPTTMIEAVVVAPDHRRQGIASALLRRIVDDSRAAGVNKVQLLSHKRHSSNGAHGVYASLGFEPEAEGFRLYLGRLPVGVLAARTR